MTPLEIAGLKVDPPWVLAPMAGHTHVAFRELVAHFGGCGLFFTEMLNSRALCAHDPRRDPYCLVGVRDRPLAAQVAGNDPEKIRRAYQRLQAMGSFDLFDFNLGCPRGAVQRYGWGARLLNRMDLCREILTASRSVLKRPFGVKMRTPDRSDPGVWDRWLEMLHHARVDALVVHPRLPQDLFKRPARWEEIACVVRRTSLPVVGNGDIFSPQDALRMMERTGCRAVMVGRAALMRPWIFRDIHAYAQGGVLPPAPEPVEVIRLYWDLLQQWLPETLHDNRLRLFFFWLCQNFPYGTHYFGQIRRQKTPKEMVRRACVLLASEKFPHYPLRPLNSY
ncbi:putative TIM-barrel protein, nifR3 family [Desulfacinum hydrothermale DSM 13146]|uniref:tRNA-dihydrouridine synthase n=1 Tax=Desulfacinum hydrothermale DSM 13146 TaxID=1121390 RepID=A0A1W1XST5_9BACT|nr:tRNA-dihydrouridine synthase [Desulfacinum hydrothermale]SMC27029.1 putative TIM-barrel protein, nifR3 family [Desulfacinum hydrothermale DSM 13146]